MICWIARNVISRDRKTMLANYKALIRPHIEYCVQLWNPVADFSIGGCPKEVYSSYRWSWYPSLLSAAGVLNFTTLAERRNRGDLIKAFKAINGQSSIGNLFKVSRSGLNLVSDMRVIKGTLKVQQLSRNFLTNRVISFWNKLPNNVKMSVSVINEFKIKL